MQSTVECTYWWPDLVLGEDVVIEDLPEEVVAEQRSQGSEGSRELCDCNLEGRGEGCGGPSAVELCR